MAIKKCWLKLSVCLLYAISYWLIYITLPDTLVRGTLSLISLTGHFVTLYLFVSSLHLILYYTLIIGQDKWLPTKIRRLDLFFLSFILLALCVVPIAHLLFSAFGDEGIFILGFFLLNLGIFMCYSLPSVIFRLVKITKNHLSKN